VQPYLKYGIKLKSEGSEKMTKLQVINQNGQLLVDSREVATMTEVRHSDLLEKIDGYKAVLDQNGEFRSDQFFIESSYEAGTGKPYKCYLLTRKGCDMAANKMTGEKGVLFTATYVTKFEEMKEQLIENKGLIDSPDQDIKRIERLLQHLKLGSKDGSFNGAIERVIREQIAETILGQPVIATEKSVQETLSTIASEPSTKIKPMGFSAKEIASLLEIHVQSVSWAARKHNLKTTEYGSWYEYQYNKRTEKIFIYNRSGKDKLLKILRTPKPKQIELDEGSL
jgi:Rha family phage regulatory protein